MIDQDPEETARDQVAGILDELLAQLLRNEVRGQGQTLDSCPRAASVLAEHWQRRDQ